MPIIADGGIRYSGDITKAIAAGADVGDDRRIVRRVGRKPGRTDSVPGTLVQGLSWHGLAGRHGQGSSERYRQSGNERGTEKLVPEGRGRPGAYKGPLGTFVYQLVGGLRAGMGYCGARNIEELERTPGY